MPFHFLMMYPLRGNAADIHCAEESSQLSEPDSDDEQWKKGEGFLSIIIIYN